ncbi:MAG: hypothetical protein JW896_03455 [Deltaproteobacteria bacterium]|nr:hypothetical protein [Deltaproteobacteria bacterium]
MTLLLYKVRMESHGLTRFPIKLPIFAFDFDAVIRLSIGTTSRRSIAHALGTHWGIVCAFIHGQARGLLRRRMNGLL